MTVEWFAEAALVKTFETIVTYLYHQIFITEHNGGIGAIVRYQISRWGLNITFDYYRGSVLIH